MFVSNVVMTLTTTAYDLYHQNYKSAALNVAMTVVPFGALFKTIFRAGKAIGAAAPKLLAAASAADNLPITEIANLAPEAVTETAMAADNLAAAASALPDKVMKIKSTVTERAIRTAGSMEAVHLFLSESDDIARVYENLKRMYLQGARSAADLMPFVRKTVGQPGWQAKLCALMSAHYVFTSQIDAPFATALDVAIRNVLRGSGYQCFPAHP
jgi:hypothetical protein